MQNCGAHSTIGETAFAPAERASRTEIEAGIASLTGHPLLRALLDAADVSVVVLNRQRQILVGNSVLLEGLGIDGISFIEGLRPGEALGCIRASQCAGGCGTAPECARCGAVLAILESQHSEQSVERECLMTVRRDHAIDALELRVRATQAKIGTETFTVVGLRDISAEKRRDALERIFLHDIANTLSPLIISAESLASQRARDPVSTARRIAILARRLKRDIEDQRVLLQAENGTLEINRAPIQLAATFEAAIAIVEGLPEATGRSLQIVSCDSLCPVVTDESLLIRVLLNMLKNALEATPEAGVVRLGAESVPGACEVRVWNAGVIAPSVASQVFKRSFSTKASRGRGLGTFSMKLFGENYLGGEVGFTSIEGVGTTFFIRLPA